MSQWDNLGIQACVEAILSGVPESEHHFGGRPFMTAYQIAIEFARDHHEQFDQLRKEVGGKDTREHYNISQYLSNELSRKILAGQITNIEGAFLSNRHIKELSFHNAPRNVESSISGNKASLSMFRFTG
jgi:hypothetical protein